MGVRRCSDEQEFFSKEPGVETHILPVKWLTKIIWNLTFFSLIPVLAVLQFTRAYFGQTLKGRDGLPFNFTWTFSGVADAAEWGIKESGVNAFTTDGKILSLKNTGQQTFHKSGYYGRVTGTWIPGQVLFAFNAVNRNDINTYLCILRADSVQNSDQFDLVHLTVEGNNGYF